jgi:glycosyltransferase involved in cell wall biosynthesis
MRVLHVIQEMQTGGAERVVLALLRAAPGNGVDAAVVAAPGDLSADLDAPRYDLRVIGRRPTGLVGAARDVRAAIRSFHPDVCHVHNPGVAVATALATRRGRHPAGLTTVHGLPDEDYPLAARLLRWSGLPVVSCGPGVDEALRHRGVWPKAMVMNGVAAAAPAANRAALLDGWGQPPKARLVVCVGRLAPVKNQRLAIEALPQLPADVVLVLVGDGSERSRLERLALRLEVHDRVVFAGARRDATAIAAAADVVVSTSKSEGMPLAVAEAMAAARPVAATDVRGTRDLIDDGVTGLLVPLDDPAALAGATSRLLRDRVEARRLGAAAAVAVAPFTESEMVRRYLLLYQELAA